MKQDKNLEYYFDSRIYTSEEIQKSIEQTKKDFPNKKVKVSIRLNDFGVYIITFKFENKNNYFILLFFFFFKNKLFYLFTLQILPHFLVLSPEFFISFIFSSHLYVKGCFPFPATQCLPYLGQQTSTGVDAPSPREVCLSRKSPGTYVYYCCECQDTAQ